MVNKKIKSVKRKKTILPSEQKIHEVWDYLINRPNLKGETKKPLHECLFLLCWKAGLRISEAIGFSFDFPHPDSDKKGLFSIRGKGEKDRWVFLNPQLISELKKRSWKPNLTTRVGFFRFLQHLKEDPRLNISENIELAPHTLRRLFATKNMSGGMPLAVMQQFLGHSRISTTALYVKDCEVDNLIKYKPIQ